MRIDCSGPPACTSVSTGYPPSGSGSTFLLQRLRCKCTASLTYGFDNTLFDLWLFEGGWALIGTCDTQ